MLLGEKDATVASSKGLDSIGLRRVLKLGAKRSSHLQRPGKIPPMTLQMDILDHVGSPGYIDGRLAKT